MDPAAMDFVVQHPPPPSNRGGLSPMTLDHQHSPCPGMRAAAAAAAAAEQNQLRGGVHTPSRSGNGFPYDPVHHNSAGATYWHPPPLAHDIWHYPSYAPHLTRSIPQHLYTPPYPGPSGFAPPSDPSQSNTHHYFGMSDNYGAHGHPHPPSHAYSPPPFHPRPSIPSLDRIGGTAPTQHSQVGFGSPANGPESHVPRTTSRLPALPQLNSPRRNGSMSASRTSDRLGFDTTQFRTGEVPAPQTGSRDSSSTVTMPPGPDSSTDLASDTARIAIGGGRGRRPRVSLSNSDPSSDEDSDPSEQELWTLRTLQSMSAGELPPSFTGSEGGLRAAQLLRGTTSGKRIASKSAIASLESVKISDLPETERTCIICYNDFGAETPEGINEAPLRLPKCKHVFGDHCIKKWFEESDSCPYCRDKVPSEAQFRQSHPQAVIQLMRQQQIHALRHARDPGSRDRSAEIGPTTSYGLPELHDTSYRRHDALPILRASGWPIDRRSPPGDFIDNRRRTRPRHGSLRNSPPSARPNHHGPSSFGLPVSTPIHVTPGGGRQYTPSHGQRHSVAFAGSPSHPRLADALTFPPNVPIPHHIPLSGAETQHHRQYPNPLAGNDPSSTRASWFPNRSQSYTTAASSTVSGPEVNMTDANDASDSSPSPRQSSR